MDCNITKNINFFGFELFIREHVIRHSFKTKFFVQTIGDAMQMLQMDSRGNYSRLSVR